MTKKNNKSQDVPPLVIFLGPQGSGKGTQAKLLVEEYGFHLTEMGGMLRAEVKKKTPLGKSIEKILDRGGLVPSWVAMDLLKKDVFKNLKKPIVVDGAPRQYIEAVGHERNIKKLGRHISMVFYITLSEKEAMQRLLKRGRYDDTPEKIKRRLAWSKAKLGKISKFFAKKYPLVKVNGEQTVAQVHKDILKALKKHKIIN